MSDKKMCTIENVCRQIQTEVSEPLCLKKALPNLKYCVLYCVMNKENSPIISLFFNFVCFSIHPDIVLLNILVSKGKPVVHVGSPITKDWLLLLS